MEKAGFSEAARQMLVMRRLGCVRTNRKRTCVHLAHGLAQERCCIYLPFSYHDFRYHGGNVSYSEQGALSIPPEAAL